MTFSYIKPLFPFEAFDLLLPDHSWFPATNSLRPRFPGAFFLCALAQQERVNKKGRNDIRSGLAVLYSGYLIVRVSEKTSRTGPRSPESSKGSSFWKKVQVEKVTRSLLG